MAEKQSILIVEDDLDLAEMLNAYFRVQGYDVLTAAWGEDGVRLCQEKSPHIVVLDIRLPDIDGYEVCRRIRANRHTKSIPIIFLTERRDRDDKLHGLELGVVDYITKPFDIQELRLRVRNALNRADQKVLINAVTGLAEGKLVEEQLANLNAVSGEAVLVAGVKNLNHFRNRYGFIAADDVLRAISFMVSNFIKEERREGDFMGHISPEELIIITTESRARDIETRIRNRLSQSIDYFYPVKDRNNPAISDREKLSLNLRRINASEESSRDDLDALRKEVLSAPH
ncbi:MAG: response regulator [Chloroflexota bacterium]